MQRTFLTATTLFACIAFLHAARSDAGIDSIVNTPESRAAASQDSTKKASIQPKDTTPSPLPHPPLTRGGISNVPANGAVDKSAIRYEQVEGYVGSTYVHGEIEISSDKTFSGYFIEPKTQQRTRVFGELESHNGLRVRDEHGNPIIWQPTKGKQH